MAVTDHTLLCVTPSTNVRMVREDKTIHHHQTRSNTRQRDRVNHRVEPVPCYYCHGRSVQHKWVRCRICALNDTDGCSRCHFLGRRLIPSLCPVCFGLPVPGQ